MRTMQQAFEAVETYSPAEERFNRRRRTTGLFAAPVVFTLVLLAPMALGVPSTLAITVVFTGLAILLSEMTAPNAIVYSSGYVPIGQMVKYGIVLDLAAFVVIVTLVTTLGPHVF